MRGVLVPNIGDCEFWGGPKDVGGSQGFLVPNTGGWGGGLGGVMVPNIGDGGGPGPQLWGVGRSWGDPGPQLGSAGDGGVLVPNFGGWGGGPYPLHWIYPYTAVYGGWGRPGPLYWGMGGFCSVIAMHGDLWGGRVPVGHPPPPPLRPQTPIFAPPPPPRAVVPQWRGRWW